MKNYPKKLYIVALLDEENNIDEWIVKTSLKDLADSEDDGTEVAVYELVRLGEVKHSKKVVFE